jgi:hypothetical protein
LQLNKVIAIPDFFQRILRILYKKFQNFDEMIPYHSCLYLAEVTAWVVQMEVFSSASSLAPTGNPQI